MRCSELVGEYRQARPQDSPLKIAIAVTTDALYRFPALALASARSMVAAAPVYAYVFSGGTGGHSEDVLYFFNNLECAPLVSRSRASLRLAEQTSSAWISFCHQVEPAVPDVKKWSPYTDERRHTLLFDNPSRIVTDPFADRRDHWEKNCPKQWVNVFRPATTKHLVSRN